MKIFIIKLVLLGGLLSGCSASQKEIEQMRYQCEEQGIINPFHIDLSFPNVEKIKKIKINRERDGRILESIEMPLRDPFIWVNKDFYTHDTYEFIIDGEKPFVLSNVKTKLQTHCTWQGCAYPCAIVEAKINGKPFVGNGSGVRLQKEGYKEVW